MKKIFSLLVVVSLIFSLCSCGDENKNILENAMLIDSLEFYQEVSENIVNAENKYKGKPVLFIEHIIEITKEYIVVGSVNTRIKVHLATEDITKVSNDQRVCVAGVIDELMLGKELSLPYVSTTMKKGYLVQNQETDNQPLYNNAKRLLSEANYMDAITILRMIDGYSNSHELLLESACKAAYEDVDGSKAWKNIFEESTPAPLTGEEIKKIIVGEWHSNVKAKNYSTYSEDGSCGYMDGFNWFVENDRLVSESKYTRSEALIYPFYKNAYVFYYPRAYNKVTEDTYELKFLNGALN